MINLTIRQEDDMALVCGVTVTEPQTAECVWCGEYLTDGAEESGYTGVGPDWCADGDYGCTYSPETTDDGVGSHRTREDLARIYVLVAGQIGMRARA